MHVQPPNLENRPRGKSCGTYGAHCGGPGTQPRPAPSGPGTVWMGSSGRWRAGPRVQFTGCCPITCPVWGTGVVPQSICGRNPLFHPWPHQGHACGSRAEVGLQLAKGPQEPGPEEPWPPSTPGFILTHSRLDIGPHREGHSHGYNFVILYT